MKFVTSCCGQPVADCPGCTESMRLIPKEEYAINMKKLGEKIGIKWEEVEFTVAQFEKGVDAEMEEHHDDPETKVISTKEEAAKVAWAHLKEDPKYYDKLAKIEESKHPIFQKIEEGSVTASDFNKLIAEATPESTRDRVRRRAKEKTSRKHLDDEGHQRTKLPTFADRVQPKREREGRTQMNGRGRVGHRHSSRTQKRTKGKNMDEARMPPRFREAMRYIQSNVGKPISEGQLQSIQDKEALNRLASRMMSQPNANRDWLAEIVRRTK